MGYLSMFRRTEPQTLRGYQLKAIEDLRQAIREGKRRIVIQMPTGGGKTLIASEIIAMARHK